MVVFSLDSNQLHSSLRTVQRSDFILFGVTPQQVALFSVASSQETNFGQRTFALPRIRHTPAKTGHFPDMCMPIQQFFVLTWMDKWPKRGQKGLQFHIQHLNNQTTLRVPSIQWYRWNATILMHSLGCQQPFLAQNLPNKPYTLAHTIFNISNTTS